MPFSSIFSSRAHPLSINPIPDHRRRVLQEPMKEPWPSFVAWNNQIRYVRGSICYLLEGGGVASGGYCELIPCIARTAVTVGVDGIFMEVHDDPLNAPYNGPTQWGHFLDGRASVGTTVDSTTENLVTTSVNAFINAGFGELQVALLLETDYLKTRNMDTLVLQQLWEFHWLCSLFLPVWCILHSSNPAK